MSRSIKFLALTFSEGFNVLVGFLFLPYLARAMEIQDYGTYGQALLVGDVFKGLCALGLSKVIFNFLANEQFSQKRTLTANIVAAFFLGIICAMLLFGLAIPISSNFQNPILKDIIWIYALSIPFQLVYSSLNSTLIFFGRVKSSAAIAVTTNLIRITLIVLSIQIYYSLELVFFSLIIVALLQILFAFMSLPPGFRSLVAVDIKLLKSQLSSGWPLGVASIIGVLFWAADGIMVSSMMDVESYAIYKNGAFQIPFISTIYSSITAILLPDISKYFFGKDFMEIIRLKKRVISNTAAIIIPTVIFCIIFAPQLIVAYFSERYAASASVFMIYNLILLARFTSYDDLFIATNNNMQMPFIYIVCLGMNVALNYVLISILGINGAAISSVISFYILIFWLFRKGTSFIDSKPTDYLDLKRIGKIFLLSISTTLIFYACFYWMNLNAILLLVVLAGYSMITYHLILKLGLLDVTLIIGLLSKHRVLRPIKNYFINQY